MLNLGCAVVFASGLMCLGIYGARSDARVPVQAQVIRRFPAPEASQAVAVDGRFFYAIASAAIGKYEKTTGQPDRKWSGEPDGRIAHLNSGVVFGARTVLRALQLSAYPDGELDRSLRHRADDAYPIDASPCRSRFCDLGRLRRWQLVGGVRPLQRQWRGARERIRSDDAGPIYQGVAGRTRRGRSRRRWSPAGAR